MNAKKKDYNNWKHLILADTNGISINQRSLTKLALAHGRPWRHALSLGKWLDLCVGKDQSWLGVRPIVPVTKHCWVIYGAASYGLLPPWNIIDTDIHRQFWIRSFYDEFRNDDTKLFTNTIVCEMISAISSGLHTWYCIPISSSNYNRRDDWNLLLLLLLLMMLKPFD